MISKTAQPTLINKPSNNSPYNAKFTKCRDSENSFSLESYAFSNNCQPLLFSWERGFSIGNSGIAVCTGTHQRCTTSRQSLVRKCTH